LFSPLSTVTSRKFFGEVRRFVISRASAYIGSSTKSKEAQIYYGADEKKCHVSLLSVDVEKYIQKPQGTGNGKILYVGSLIERKGVDLLLNAVSKLTNPFDLYLAGGGEELENLKRMARELGVAEYVHFLGQLSREELLVHYANSDFFVLPTREDCFALVILEAICSGLPIVCSKYADGAYDMIEDGDNGFIVDPYDTDAFAEKIDLLLKDQELAQKMRKETEKVIDKFRFANIADGYLAAVETSLER